MAKEQAKFMLSAEAREVLAEHARKYGRSMSDVVGGLIIENLGPSRPTMASAAVLGELEGD